MPVPSLLQLAQKKAIRNTWAIPDVGLVPYHLLKPILAKIEKAEHLRSLELKSPHIQEDTGELWINFIKRDVPGWDQIELPSNPDCWYDVYRELMEQAQEQLNRDAQKMKSALEELNSDRARNTARVIDPQALRFLPKERPTQKQRYAAHDRRMGGLTPVFAAPGTGGYGSGGGGFGNLDGPIHNFETPRLPRGGSGKSSSSSGLFAPVKRKKALSVPTHQLTSRATPVRQAPRAFVHEHKIAQATKPVPKAGASAGSKGRVIAPGRQRGPGNSSVPTSSPALQEREARLRSLTSSRPKSESPMTSTSTTSPKPKATAAVMTPAKTTPSTRPTPTSSQKPKASTAATTKSPPPTSPPKTITLLGCAPSAPPRRITRVQTSPQPKSAAPISKPTATTTSQSKSPPTTKPEDATSEPTSPTASSPPDSSKPAPPMIRKRPPPKIFIQPKKRKIA